MDRRKFLGASAIGAAALAGGCTQAEQSASGGDSSSSSPSAPNVNRGQSRELTMVTTWPQNFPGLGDMATRTAEMIGRLTDGELTVRVYAAGELVPPFESFDAVAEGAADMYHAADYYWQGKAPGFSFFTAVPMGLTADEMMGWIKFGGGQEVWDELGAEFGVKCLPAGNTGHQMGGWFKREINSLEDFRGLTMRIPGLGGEALRQVGVSVVNLPGGEVFPALQSGAIDGTEWVGPWNDLAFGVYRVASYYYGPGFHEPGSLLSCGFNLGVWESLSERHRNAVSVACDWATTISIAEYQHQNALALTTLVDEHGVELRSFPDDVWAEVRRVADQVVADIGASDAMTQRIYDSYASAREKALLWSSVSDGPYMRQRAGGI